MRKFFFKNFNFVLLFILSLPFIAIQSTLFKYSIFSFFQPNFALVIVAYLGLKRGIIEGGALALLLGRAIEVSSGIYPDVMPVTFFAIFLTAKLIKSTVFIPDIFTVVLFVMFISVLEKVLILLFMAIPGGSLNLWKHILMMGIPDALVNGIIAIWAFGALIKFDKLTFKDPSVDNEYDIINKDFDS